MGYFLSFPYDLKRDKIFSKIKVRGSAAVRIAERLDEI